MKLFPLFLILMLVTSCGDSGENTNDVADDLAATDLVGTDDTTTQAVDDDYLTLSFTGLADPTRLVDGEVKLGPNQSVLAAFTVSLTQKAVDAGVVDVAYDIVSAVEEGTDWSQFLTSSNGNVTSAAAAGFDLEIAAGADASTTGRIVVTLTRRDQVGTAKVKQHEFLLRRE